MIRKLNVAYPINMKRKQAVVIKAPLLDGDNMPNMATTMTDTHTIVLARPLHTGDNQRLMQAMILIFVLYYEANLIAFN